MSPDDEIKESFDEMFRNVIAGAVLRAVLMQRQQVEPLFGLLFRPAITFWGKNGFSSKKNRERFNKQIDAINTNWDNKKHDIETKIWIVLDIRQNWTKWPSFLYLSMWTWPSRKSRWRRSSFTELRPYIASFVAPLRRRRGETVISGTQNDDVTIWILESQIWKKPLMFVSRIKKWCLMMGRLTIIL